MIDTVQVELTEDDLVAFMVHHFRTEQSARRARRLNRCIYFGTCLVLLAASLVVWILGDDPKGFLVGAVFLMLLAGWLERVWQQMPRKQVAQLMKHGYGRAILEPMTISIQADGLRAATSIAEEFVSWQGFIKVIRDRERAYFYTTPVNAIMLPRRAFDSDASYESFVLQIETAVNAAPIHHIRCPKCRYDLRKLIVHVCPECGWRRGGEHADAS